MYVKFVSLVSGTETEIVTLLLCFGEQANKREKSMCHKLKQNRLLCVLLQLDRPFSASEAVKAVEFLRAGGTNPVTDAQVETAGWGSLDNLGSRPDKLKEVVVDVFNPDLCGRSDYYGEKFTSNMMCAHRVCPRPCRKPQRKEDSCDVSFLLLHQLHGGRSS